MTFYHAWRYSKKSGIPIDQYVFHGKRKASFQKETLQVLGLHDDQILYSSKNLHLQAKELIIPSFTGGHRPSWVGHFLRQELLPNMNLKSSTKKTRIYISRANASKRRIQNEEKVVDYLSQFGFQSVKLETLPIKKQMELFATAEYVVAPHGAGLANLIFCQPGTKVLELFPREKVKRCYWVVSYLAEVDYYYLLGKGQDPNHHIQIGLEELSQMLEKMGLQKEGE